MNGTVEGARDAGRPYGRISVGHESQMVLSPHRIRLPRPRPPALARVRLRRRGRFYL